MHGGFVGELGPTVRASLDGLGRRRSYAAGAPIFLEGDRGATVVIIHSGRVKIFATSDDGRETVLAIRGPGDILGDLNAVDGRSYSASGTALEAVDAQVISNDSFRTFLNDVPGAALALLRVVTTRIRDSDRRRIEFGTRDTLSRVTTMLIDLAETQGEPGADGSCIMTGLTQDDLAGLAGASREAVARALASLRRRGLITTARRCITVANLDQLRENAN